MADMTTLLQRIDDLSSAELEALYSYVAEKYERLWQATLRPDTPRAPGKNPSGGGWLNEEFFESLPDDFWPRTE